MTAVEVPPVANLFSPLRRPETWRTGARVMLASPVLLSRDLSILVPVLLYQSQSHEIIELATTGPPLGIDETLSCRRRCSETETTAPHGG